MSNDKYQIVYNDLLLSEYVQDIENCQSIWSSLSTYSPLTPNEINELKQNGNTADNWDNVRKFQQHLSLNTQLIRNCNLQGFVVFGNFSSAESLNHHNATFSPGCYNSIIRNCMIYDNALVSNTTLISQTFLMARSSVVGCGFITCPQVTSFGNGEKLSVGVETGGRDLCIIADLPFHLASQVVCQRDNASLQQQYNDLVKIYTEKVTCSFNVIKDNARILHCSRIDGIYLGNEGVIEDSDVWNSTLLSTTKERTKIESKSIVKNSILQWQCHIEHMSVVNQVFMCDCTHIARHAAVMNAVIGPNTSIAEGEVSSSFVGPFVGFHHQALLIASVWPQGKGNIGYGANVGSNHTLKAPDQEIFPGEGVFFGLGCNVKFPSNFTKAPYSVIATAVTSLPQRVEMPFSLINTPSHNVEGLSPAINEISPGWVLAHSVFTVLRNQLKFTTRNKSTRTAIDSAIFRTEIIQYMIDARSNLERAKGKAKLQLPNSEEVYTDKEIIGLGKNYMLESKRLEAIQAYTFYIKMFALNKLLMTLETQPSLIRQNTVGNILDHVSIQFLEAEFPSNMLLRDCLELLIEMQNTTVKNAASGKLRDDRRGQRIHPDYESVHKPVFEEQVVLSAQRMALQTTERAKQFLARF